MRMNDLFHSIFTNKLIYSEHQSNSWRRFSVENLAVKMYLKKIYIFLLKFSRATSGVWKCERNSCSLFQRLSSTNCKSDSRLGYHVIFIGVGSKASVTDSSPHQSQALNGKVDKRKKKEKYWSKGWKRKKMGKGVWCIQGEYVYTRRVHQV